MTRVVYREHLQVGARGWGLLVLAVLLTVFAVSVVLVPVTILAWFVNVVRFRRSTIVVTDDQVWVGRRSAPLSAFDLTTLGRGWNTWPWRYFSSRWLGANPVWTRDSVGLTGSWNGKVVWLSVGSNHREELVAALTDGVRRQQAAIGQAMSGQRPGGWAPPVTTSPPPGWYPDPWNPVGAVRWWDGSSWTGQVATRSRGRR